MANKRFRSWLLVASAAAATGATVVALTVVTDGSRGSGTGDSSSSRAALAEPGVNASPSATLHGGETFRPDASGRAPQLTAGQAWADYQTSTSSAVTPLPADAQVYLGDLTIPVDPQDPTANRSYRAKDAFAYGYELPDNCAPVVLPSGASSSAHPGLCTAWVFLNADTGKIIEVTYDH